MIRIVLGGSGLDNFTPNESTDQYINAYFIPENASYSPPFDLEEVRTLVMTKGQDQEDSLFAAGIQYTKVNY